MKKPSHVGNVISWGFGGIFLILGLLNMFLVHPIPGLIYVFFATMFIPPTNIFLQKRFGFMIPLFVKIILGILMMWFTLGVSDLMEMFEASIR